MNQVLTDTNALNNAQSYQYDLAGDLTQKTDRNGRTIEWTYDALRRVTSEAWMQGTSSIYTINYAYNADNELTSVSDPDSSYAYAYNALGEQTSVDNSGTPNVPHVVLTSGYDLMGDRTSLSATIAANADFLNNYSYDGDQNLTQITQQGQTGGNGVATKGVNYAYNLAGQVTSQVDYTQLGSNPPAIVTGAYSYDNAGRLTGIDYTHSTTTLDNMTWTLDAAGRVEDFTSSVDGTAAYSYDNANQLLGATYTGNGEPPNESYSFDSNGNRSMTGYTTGTNNQTTSDGTYNYSYDADGNRVTRTQISSTQNSDYKTTYSYDYRNRLTDVYDYNNSGTLTAHYHYVYDVWDNLIGEEIDPTGGGTYTSSRWYAWDVGSGLPIAGQPSLVAGPAGPGGVVAQFDGSGSLLVRYFDGPEPDGRHGRRLRSPRGGRRRHARRGGHGLLHRA